MKINKIIGTIVILIGVILIGVGVVISMKTISSSKDNDIENKEEQVPKIVYSGVEYSNYSFIQEDGKNLFQITLKNLGSEPIVNHESQITFYDEDNKKIYSTEHVIFKLENTKTIKLIFKEQEIPKKYTIKVSEYEDNQMTG